MDMSALPKASQLAALGRHAQRWRPGLAASGAKRSLYNEIFAPADEAAGASCLLALAFDGLAASEQADAGHKAVLWVQDQRSRTRSGYPCRAGLPAGLRHRLIHVATRKPEDALFALEEGMRCRDLAFVIGEIAGNPRALDLTASRRFALAAEQHGVPLFLLRHDAKRDLSAARMRWQVCSAASRAPYWNADAPGAGRWHAELFRARGHAPGEWILRDDTGSLAADPVHSSGGAPDHGDLAGAAGARSLAAL